VAEHGIEPIDMVVVNLYAFEKTAASLVLPSLKSIENIDIGGPFDGALRRQEFRRCSHRNFRRRLPVRSQKSWWPTAASEPGTRWRLAQQAFATTAAYDTAIANTLERIASSEAEASVQFTDTELPKHFASPTRWPCRCAMARIRIRVPASLCRWLGCWHRRSDSVAG